MADKFTVVVEATDRGEAVKLSSSTTVIINVLDGNNNHPIISRQTVGVTFKCVQCLAGEIVECILFKEIPGQGLALRLRKIYEKDLKEQSLLTLNSKGIAFNASPKLFKKKKKTKKMEEEEEEEMLIIYKWI